MVEQGTYRGLLDANGDFTNLMEEHASINSSAKDTEGSPASEDGRLAEGDDAVAAEKAMPKKVEAAAANGQDGKLMTVEERAKGVVERSVFTYYISQVGTKLALSVLVLYIGGNFVRVFRDWWLSRWATFDLSVVMFYNPDTWSEYVTWSCRTLAFGS